MISKIVTEAKIAASRLLNSSRFEASPTDFAGAIPTVGRLPREIEARIQSSLAGPGSKKTAREYNFIKPYFDTRYYLINSPDVLCSGVDPIDHYITHGSQEGRAPSADFAAVLPLLSGNLTEHKNTPFARWIKKYEARGENPGTPPDEPDVTNTAQAEISDDAWRRAQALFDNASAAHYGDKFHMHILACWLQSCPEDYGFEYALIKPHFDIAYYLAMNPDILRKGLDPIAHYVRAGGREGRDPTPLFSSKVFRDQHKLPKTHNLTPFGAWILQMGMERGASVPFEQFDTLSRAMGLSSAEALDHLHETQSSLAARLMHGTLGEQVRKASEIEPLIEHSWPNALGVRIAPFNSQDVISRTTHLFSMQEQAQMRRAKAVVLVNRPRWGSGRRMEGHLTHALAELYGANEVVVVMTEQGGSVPEGRLPEGIRIVNGEAPSSKPVLRERALFEFLRSLKPEIVFNINSRTCWEMFQSYGKTLCAEMRVVSGLFCAEQTASGYWTGYPIRHFYRYFDDLHAVCPDSYALCEELTERFMIPPSEQVKMQVLSAPVDPSIPMAQYAKAPEATERPKVYWAGRFDPQKRIDIVYRIAHAMPEVDFHMWGERLLNAGAQQVIDIPPNVIFEGMYQSFNDVPMHDGHVWLYTSEWDGVPSMLLEVAMTGMPIVGSLVGGTGEVLRDTHSYPVSDIHNPAAYVEKIKHVLSNLDLARKQALQLRETLVAERTSESYLDGVRRIVERGLGAAK